MSGDRQDLTVKTENEMRIRQSCFYICQVNTTSSMKNIFPAVFLLFLYPTFAQSPLNLIPQPVEVKQGSGVYTLTATGSIGYNQPEARNAAEMLAAKINTATGFKFNASNTKNAGILILLNSANDKKIGDEGYELNVTAKGVMIRANKPAGLFYGVQTLLQLLPPEIESKTAATGVIWSVPQVQIMDYPRFAWRGIMLDVSRHFFSKQDVMTYIDEIARYKYNVFHWHLTDDNGWRIEIKSLPKLTQVGAWRVPRYGRFGERDDPKPFEPATDGGFYTQDDIREVIRYAAARNITIVPEIDVPGHSMAALASYPELSCQKKEVFVNPGTHFADWFDNGTFRMNIENTLNPSDEKVYEFLDKVFSEVAALFPCPYIHVGGDECYKGYWKDDPGCQALMKQLGIRHVEDLQGYFMGRVEKILESKGKKLLGWDEILEGGISPNATVMSWRGIKGGIEAAQMGHQVVMTPTTFAYLDYNQGDQTIDPPIYAGLRTQKSYSFEPVPDGVDAKYILGGQGNLWTEQVPTLHYAEYMTFPRAWALAEVYWSQKSAKDWNGFTKRMEAHFNRSNFGDVNYSKAVYDPLVTTKMNDDELELTLATEIPDLKIYYSIDESMPDNHSLLYEKPVNLPRGPINLRVQAYRNGNPIGHLITLSRKQLESRAE